MAARSNLPGHIEVLYQEIVTLGGGVYRGFVPRSKDYPDRVLFEDSEPAHRGYLLALPAKTICASDVRLALLRSAHEALA